MPVHYIWNFFSSGQENDDIFTSKTESEFHYSREALIIKRI